MGRSIVALAFALVLAPTTAKAAATDDALAAVKKTLDAALGIARAGGTEEQQLVSLRAMARDFLDTRVMGRRAIGDVLAAQPPEKQQDYFDLFDQLMVRAYLQKLLLFRAPHFDYGEPHSLGEGVIVKTKIITSKDEFHVDYDMRQREGRWLATDVIVEGISLAKNYQAQFTSLMRDHSFEELLELMRRSARVAEKPK